MFLQRFLRSRISQFKIYSLAFLVQPSFKAKKIHVATSVSYTHLIVLTAMVCVKAPLKPQNGHNPLFV